MEFKGKTVGLTGADGFLGGALAKELRKQGAIVKIISGDTRKLETFSSVVDHQMEYLFHFGSPSSQIVFKRQPLYSAEVTIKGFINAVSACQNNGVKLVYPSTGLLSQGDVNEYARCKKICEDIAIGENIDSIGVRIFATYGVGEDHKRDYASVPFLFARDIVNGYKPVIYGDGSQVRDFIYIDDTVKGILNIAEKCNEKVIDLGYGKETSFNELIKLINIHNKTEVQAEYVDKPMNYVDKTKSNCDTIKKYYIPEIGIDEGIEKIVKNLRGSKQ